MIDGIEPLIEDAGEFTLDLLLPEGFLKDAPIIGPIFSCVTIGKSLHDRILICKLEAFLKCVDNNPKWKKRFSDIDECQHIAKHLLYIIDSSDDDKKLKLIALAFNQMVRGELCREDFFYLSSMISKSFFPYLRILLDIDEANGRFPNDGTYFDETAIAHLLNLGLFDYNGQTMAIFGGKGDYKPPTIIVVINKYGCCIKKLLQAESNRTNK